MRALSVSLALLVFASAPGTAPYAACAGLTRAAPAAAGAPAVRAVSSAAAGLAAPWHGLLAPTPLPSLAPSLAGVPLPQAALSAAQFAPFALPLPAPLGASVPAPAGISLRSAAPAARAALPFASSAAADAPAPGGRPSASGVREGLAAGAGQGRSVDFDGDGAAARNADPVPADTIATRTAPLSPSSASPSSKRYYLTGAAVGETRFGPAGYFVHFGVLKGLTIFLKSQVLFLAGGLPAVAVYLLLLPVKVPAFVRIQSLMDHQYARPFISSVAGGLTRRGLKLPGSASPLNPRDELVLMPGATAVVQGQRSEPRPAGLPSLGGAVVNRMGHRFRFLVAADRELDPAAAPARAGGLSAVDGSATVTLSAHRGAEDLGVGWTMSVSEFVAGRAMDRGAADALREAAGRRWLRDGAARAALYVLASVALGALFHPLHLDVAVGVTVFILLELNHKAHGLALWRKHLGADADRASPLSARWRAFRSEAWDNILEDRTLRIEASVAAPEGSADLGAVASGFGAMRMAGAGLRQQARALELPAILIALSAGFSALSAFGVFGLEPGHAVLALVFLALAAGMAGGFRALWRRYSGKRKTAESSRPVGATRFVRQAPRVPAVTLGALAVFAAAPLAGLSWPFVTAVGVLAGAVVLLDLHKFLTGVTRTPGGGHGGWVWELLDLLLTP